MKRSYRLTVELLNDDSLESCDWYSTKKAAMKAFIDTMAELNADTTGRYVELCCVVSAANCGTKA